MSAPTYHPAIDDFLAHIDQIEREAIVPTRPDQPRRFVPQRELQLYLTEPTLRTLLLCYGLATTEAEAIHKGFLVVFTILASIHKATYIIHFLPRYRLADEYLPFLKADDFPHRCRPFFDDFNEAQWRFCAQHLRGDRLNDTRLENERIVPFLNAKLLSNGPDSYAYQVEIHPAYNGLVENEHDAPAMTNVFLLKTCPARLVRLHNDEVHAYKTMRGQEGVSANMVRFYGSWRQGDTYHMLLEYVDGGTLESYLKDTPPPTRREDIIMFWERIFDLVNLLARIHEHEDPNDRGSIIEGIHHDIKPSNILVKRSRSPTSRFDVTFKLADFGLADFQRSSSTRAKPRRRDVSGNQAYSAPECFRDEADHSAPHAIRQASPKKDVWSMGCVLSEAAVWSVLLQDGLEEYQRVRVDATNQILGFAPSAYSGCFHDGDRVLPVVLTMHERVRSERRANDNVIEPVLTIIEDMLDTPERRQSALWMYERFSKLVMRKARAGSISPTSPHDTASRSSGPHSPTNETPRQPPPELPPGHPLNALGIGFNPLPLTPKSATPMYRMSNGVHHTQSVPPAPLDETKRRTHSGFGYTVNEPQESGRRPMSEQYAHYGVSYGSTSPFRHNRNGSENLPGNTCPTLHHNQYLGHGTAGPTVLNTESQAEGHDDQAPEVSHHAPERPTTQTRSSSEEKLPEATIREYERWIAFKKDSCTVKPPEGHHYLAKLNGRDQIFLFDDSSSMGDQWDECKRTFQVLAYLVKDKDPDGIEIRFASDPSKRMQNKNRAPLLTCLNNTRPSGLTDIACTLAEILSRYDWTFSQKKGGLASRLRMGKKQKEMKWGVDICVFTDGVWEGGDRCLKDVAEAIKQLIARGVQPRQIGIQFVQFGNDSEGTRRLEILDNGMHEYGVPKDIIDTERCDGNVFKMLLGGSSRLWDGDNSGSPVAPTTTAQPQSTTPGRPISTYRWG